MKKATSLLLVLTMVLSLFAGCGKPAAQEATPQVPPTTPSAETAAPTTEPTTEPTLSPNTGIITDHLLTKATDLPAASCEKLPADWHGVVMDDMQMIYDNNHWDNNIYEYEIQAVKTAGFNYIGLELDFNWLQDFLLYSDRTHVGQLGQKEDKGKLSLERLEQLDQVRAFCIPAIQTSTYEQVADYPYYIDQGMMSLFQIINGVQ